MWTQGPVNGSSSLVVPHLANTNREPLFVDTGGVLVTGSWAQGPRWEYWEHSGSHIATMTGSVLQINGQLDSASKPNFALTTWNTASSVFQPRALGEIYTVRLMVIATPVGGNPILHVDTDVSGRADSEWGRHHQSMEALIRATGIHQHVHAHFKFFVDDDLLVSGATFRVETTSGTVSIPSASILIVEG